MRVSPLRYASLIKWFTNQSEGIPAYIKIDMATQNTELVKLDEGMKYTTSDHSIAIFTVISGSNIRLISSMT